MSKIFSRFISIPFGAATLASAAPTITTQPSPPTQTVNAGATVTYSVTASGTGTLTYQWMKRTTGPFAGMTGATNATLSLPHVQATDAASYRVTVTDSTGSINSAIVSLTVAGAPPVITPTAALQHTAVALGSTAMFTVTAAGSGTLSYHWKKNGADLAGQTSADLSFAAAQAGDEADYTVTVSNVFGTVTSEPARLWVVPPASQFIGGSFTDAYGFRVPYFYILPSNYDAAQNYPLWIMFHGASDDETTFVAGTGAQGFSRVCVSYARQAADPAIAVYITRRAGAAGSGGWSGYAPVVLELVASLATGFGVDTERIYVVGESAGGRPAVELVTLNPAFFAAFMICDGTGDASTVSAISGLPLWAVWSQGDTVVTGTPSWVQAFRRAGGKAVFTQFVTPSHASSIGMGLSLPAAVDWLFAQRRGVASTNEPLVAIATPTVDDILRTQDKSVSLTGTATALGRAVSGVTWENATTSATGTATGTHAWSTAPITLAADRSSRLLVTAVVGTTWAPAYGGSTSFNDVLLVTTPLVVSLVPQSAEQFLLSWAGGYAPYRVQRSPDLATWIDVNTNAIPPVSVTTDAPRGFYRVIGQ
jgi:hypothetical protein